MKIIKAIAFLIIIVCGITSAHSFIWQNLFIKHARFTYPLTFSTGLFGASYFSFDGKTNAGILNKKLNIGIGETACTAIASTAALCVKAFSRFKNAPNAVKKLDNNCAYYLFGGFLMNRMIYSINFNSLLGEKQKKGADESYEKITGQHIVALGEEKKRIGFLAGTSATLCVLYNFSRWLKR